MDVVEKVIYPLPFGLRGTPCNEKVDLTALINDRLDRVCSCGTTRRLRKIDLRAAGVKLHP
jgi:hypothetical protein